MNILARRSVLAIAAVVDVAIHSRKAPVAARALAARHKLPSRHLETLLQGLVHAKILTGVRGPRGGYELARERRRITVGEIVRVVRTLESGDDLLEGETGSLLGRQVVRPLWAELQEELMKQLDTVTIEELCTRAHRTGVAGEYAARLDFSI
jgi:Rrf2 family iron-sulfur cluster assembly transcriptional regulator